MLHLLNAGSWGLNWCHWINKINANSHFGQGIIFNILSSVEKKLAELLSEKFMSQPLLPISQEPLTASYWRSHELTPEHWFPEAWSPCCQWRHNCFTIYLSSGTGTFIELNWLSALQHSHDIFLLVSSSSKWPPKERTCIWPDLQDLSVELCALRKSGFYMRYLLSWQHHFIQEILCILEQPCCPTLQYELYWSVFFPASLEGKAIKVNIANTQDRKATGEESWDAPLLC